VHPRIGWLDSQFMRVLVSLDGKEIAEIPLEIRQDDLGAPMKHENSRASQP